MGNRGPVHWAWVILGTCFISLFVNYSIRLGYGIILPEMIEALGFTRTAAGSIYNAYLVAYISLTPLTGYLTDRFGARRVITSCGLFLGLGTLLMGTSDNLLKACFFFGFVGVGATGMWTSIVTVVQRWFADSRRGLALGILSPGYGLGVCALRIHLSLDCEPFQLALHVVFYGVSRPPDDGGQWNIAEG